MTDDKLITKIMKLLALAEGTNHPDEAQTFFDKAEELMLRYAIDAAVLDAERVKAGGGRVVAEKPVRVTFAYANGRTRETQKAALLNAIALTHGVKLIRDMQNNKYRPAQIVFLLGYQSDIDFVTVLYASILLQAERASGKGYKTYRTSVPGWSPYSVTRHIWVKSFLDGFNTETYKRLKLARERASGAIAETSGPGTELVLVDRAKAVEDLLASEFPKTRKAASRRSQYSPEARQAGLRAGENADLSGGRNNLRDRAALR